MYPNNFHHEVAFIPIINSAHEMSYKEGIFVVRIEITVPSRKEIYSVAYQRRGFHDHFEIYLQTNVHSSTLLQG